MYSCADMVLIKTIFGCTEESRSYCCFKSILAKIINREGRKQLGLSLETCEGITVEQLQKLDFSKIDMTEFQNSVVPKTLIWEIKQKRLENG